MGDTIRTTVYMTRLKMNKLHVCHQVHTEFANSSWHGWDHMMDQHLGLWYDGEEESCLELSETVRDGLESAGISVGERQESDAHEMYSGYSGSISWEVREVGVSFERTTALMYAPCTATYTTSALNFSPPS